MAFRDWLWIILLGGIWGTSFVYNEVLIREIGPLTVSSLRVGIGALGCWVFVVALKKKLPRQPALYAHLLLLGTLSYAIPFALYPLSQGSLTSGVAAIINAMTPLMTVVVSHFWPGGERASVTKSFGVIAGLAGVTVLALPALSGGGDTQLWAIGACLLATVCYAISLNYTRSLGKIDPTVFAACALTGASITAVPTALVFEGLPVITRTETWLSALGIGLIATALAFQIMYRILPRIGATNFSTVTFLAPVSAIFLGIVILGESILPSHVGGMALIFLGLILIDGRLTRRLRRKSTVPPPPTPETVSK